MSDFLEAVSAEDIYTSLWRKVRCSTGEIEDAMRAGFSWMFGKNWEDQIPNCLSTQNIQKMAADIFYHAMDRKERIFEEHRPAFYGRRSVRFDRRFFNYDASEAESGPSSGVQSDAFAVVRRRYVDKKAERILAVKLKTRDYRLEKIFAAVIDLGAAKNKDTGWHAADAGGGRFAALKIARQDRGIVVPLCGKIVRRHGAEFVDAECRHYYLPMHRRRHRRKN